MTKYTKLNTLYKEACKIIGGEGNISARVERLEVEIISKLPPELNAEDKEEFITQMAKIIMKTIGAPNLTTTEDR